MIAAWLITEVEVSRLPAKPPRAGRAQLRDAFPGFDAVQIDNEWLTLRSGGACGVPGTRERLNAFFAISVNSPSMSMVNFSCCVGSAQMSCALGVTRRVTPQPTRAALQMEAGAHVCV
jgi:hypothetical protein